MSRTKLKRAAQDRLLEALPVAFERLHRVDYTAELETEMSRQMERIESLFGYKSGSWGRGV